MRELHNSHISFAEMGLSAKEEQRLTAAIRPFTEIRQIWVYGSRAMGNYRHGSDVDWALDAPEMTFQRFLAFKGALEDTNILLKFDVLLLHQLEDEMLWEHLRRHARALVWEPVGVPT